MSDTAADTGPPLQDQGRHDDERGWYAEEARVEHDPVERAITFITTTTA